MIRQYVAFGQNMVFAIQDEDWKEAKYLFEDDPNCLFKRDCKTEEERKAYVDGIYDMGSRFGWCEVHALSKEEAAKLSKRIRLSEIPESEGCEGC